MSEAIAKILSVQTASLSPLMKKANESAPKPNKELPIEEQIAHFDCQRRKLMNLKAKMEQKVRAIEEYNGRWLSLLENTKNVEKENSFYDETTSQEGNFLEVSIDASDMITDLSCHIQEIEDAIANMSLSRTPATPQPQQASVNNYDEESDDPRRLSVETFRALKKLGDIKTEFQDIYVNFIRNREEMIDELREIIGKTKTVTTSCSITKVIGCGVSLVGAVAAFVVPPVGIAVVVAGTITSGAGTVSQWIWTPSDMPKYVKNMTERDKEYVEKMENTCNTFIYAAKAFVAAEREEQKANSRRKNDRASQLWQAGRVAGRVTSTTGATIGKVVIRTKKAMQAAGIAARYSRTEIRGLEILADSAGVVRQIRAAEVITEGASCTAGVASSALKATKVVRTLRVVTHAFVFIGVAMDVWEICASADDLANGSQTEFSKQVGRQIRYYEENIEDMEAQFKQIGVLE